MQQEKEMGFSPCHGATGSSFKEYRAYIANNPVKACLVDSPEKYPYCFDSLARKKAETQRVHAVTVT
jgi:hypothetical protein